MNVLNQAYINALLADMSYIDFDQAAIDDFNKQSTGHPKV